MFYGYLELFGHTELVAQDGHLEIDIRVEELIQWFGVRK